MTSAAIRQSFLDFFRSKQHTLVPSSSLLPDSPNLLFTNAGMNQFVPIFLGERKADVSKWAGAVPALDTRAADTQKCIRAGGKHNDLDDVGLDTYHHTFFEMLGNWSFGDYFKAEAIAWAWELVVEVWKFPPQRIYATIYQPGPNDPADRDQEAWELWAAKFRSVGLDPAIHIVNGGKKDNFWMMGETGPCGPCTEIHVDLRPGPRETDVETQQSGAKLVNGSDARCIEIWNNVFIQYNANPDGTFSPLPAKHVDTGMGFERVTSIIQGTKGLTDFQHARISNYETDIFRPIFDELERMSGKKYGSTLPSSGTGASPVIVPQAPSPAGAGTNQQAGAPVAPATGGGACATSLDGSASVPLKTTGEAPSDIVVVESGSTEYPKDPCGIIPEQPQVVEPRPSAEQVQLDIAFRVIADHIRTLSFAIADGIAPGNTDRNYVLRRILRRAVRYGRTLGFHEPFFYKLVDVLAKTMGDVFPEIRTKQQHVKDVLKLEEEAFNKTLDRGLELFNRLLINEKTSRVRASEHSHKLKSDKIKLDSLPDAKPKPKEFWAAIAFSATVPLGFGTDPNAMSKPRELLVWDRSLLRIDEIVSDLQKKISELWNQPDDERLFGCFLLDYPKIYSETISKLFDYSLTPLTVSAKAAFLLYDTYGFPLDLTELMAREHGLTVDTAGFEILMEEQRARARAAQKKTVIELSQIETKTPTHFLGYDHSHTGADVQEVVQLKDKTVVVLNNTVCYAEMGGQVGDTAELSGGGQLWRVTNTQKSGNTVLHFIEGGDAPAVGSHVTLQLDSPRRAAIQRHHTVTHLLHWALHEVASREASQKGSSVTPEKLTFDFNSAPLTSAQVADIEKLVNERILENAGVSWTEVPHAEVKQRPDVMQFFGDKYGDIVRVVQIGGHAAKLDGYSMELCGGTHTRATGEIGLFRILGENAIAAGVRRIEAVAGLSAYAVARHELDLLRTVAGKVSAPVADLEKKIDALLAHQKELEKQVRIALQRNASNAAGELLGRATTVNGIPLITHNLGDADAEFLQAVSDALKGRFPGVIVLGGGAANAVTLIAHVSPEFTARVQAGKIIQTIAPIIGGKGGGKPDHARGGGKDATKLDEALAKARTLL